MTFALDCPKLFDDATLLGDDRMFPLLYMFPMDNENKVARNSILSALLTLMRQKKIDDIRIKELCRVAGVSRSTFHRNFESKEQVIELYFDSHFELLFERVESLSRKTPNELYKYYFNFMMHHSELIHLLRINQREHILTQCMIEYLPYLMHHNIVLSLDVPTNYEVDYLANGLSALTFSWESQNFEETPAQMANIFQLLLRIAA